MKIIIPMAGEGSRFKNIGLTTPKHQIIANGHSLFRWSMLSLSDFFDCQFIFIYKNGSTSIDFIKRECKTIGINDYKFIPINSTTDGQASTVMGAEKCIGSKDEVCIYNIDTYVEPGNILKRNIPDSSFGHIPSFVSEGNKWSFVKTKTSESNLVIQVSEKIRISPLGSIGFYYFKYWESFKKIYFERKDEIINKYNESYIAPMYQYLIDHNKAVTTSNIKTETIHVLGTPEDLSQFCPDYLLSNS